MNPETEPLKIGEQVTVNNEKMIVQSVDKTGNPQFKAVVSEEAIKLWHDTVRSIIRKAKGLKPEEEVELPNNETGRYIKYAFDAQGRLSTGKGHGRRKVRLKPHQDRFNRLASLLFSNYLASIFKAERTKKEKDPAYEIGQVTPKQIEEAKHYGQARAAELLASPRKAAAKAARKRHRLARRINFGLIAGNRNRSTHAA